MDVRIQPDTYNTMHIASELLAPASNSRITHIRHEGGSDTTSQLYMMGDNYESQNWLYRDRSATEAIYASDSYIPRAHAARLRRPDRGRQQHL